MRYRRKRYGRRRVTRSYRRRGSAGRRVRAVRIGNRF